MTDTTLDIRRGIDAIADGCEVDAIAETLGRLDSYLSLGKELKAALERAMFDRIQATGRDITIGSIRYYAGTRKTTKPRDPAECLQTLVERFGPAEVGKNYLGAGAFKHGSIRTALGDSAEFDRLFETTEAGELMEGKPVKRLLTVNEAFVK